MSQDRLYTCQFAGCTKSTEKPGTPQKFAGRSGRPNKYCSHGCYADDKRNKPMPESTYRKVMEHRVRKAYTKKCLFCLKEFTAEKANRKYCSVTCASAARGDQLRGKSRSHAKTLVMIA